MQREENRAAKNNRKSSSRSNEPARNRLGQSIGEYALILALVAVTAVLALTTLGGESANTMQKASNAIGEESQQQGGDGNTPSGGGCG